MTAPALARSGSTPELRLELGPAAAATAARLRAAGAEDDAIGYCLAAGGVGQLIDANRARRQHVVVACMPKSASTFFCQVLVNATGFQPYLLNTIGHDTEHNIDRLAIPMFLCRDTVSQEHMRATRPNVTLLRRMSIRPVVLVRDIFDVIVSACDHAERVSGSGPAAHLPPDFARWPRRDRLWFVVRMGTPWFLSFVTSWLEAAATLDLLWVTYGDAVRRTEATARRVLRHAGVPVSDERIVAGIRTIDPAATRFNQGVGGRGADELTAAQREAVREIAATYDDHDLAIIGLPRGALTDMPTVHEIQDAAVPTSLSLVLEDPEAIARAAAWRSGGVDERTVFHCAQTAEERLQRIIESNRASHRQIFIACVPKSASTYLNRVLLRVTGFADGMLVVGGEDDEQDIARSRIPELLLQDSIARQHARATRDNVDLLRRMGLRPVVLVRDLLDTLVSMVDHLTDESVVGPVAHVPASFPRWPLERRRWFVVRMCTPWCLSFVTSWRDAERALDLLWISYRDVVDDTVCTVDRILRHGGVAVDRDHVATVVEDLDPAEARFNRGVVGRGREELTAAQREAVREIAAAYRGRYDLSIIGL